MMSRLVATLLMRNNHQVLSLRLLDGLTSTSTLRPKTTLFLPPPIMIVIETPRRTLESGANAALPLPEPLERDSRPRMGDHPAGA